MIEIKTHFEIFELKLHIFAGSVVIRCMTGTSQTELRVAFPISLPARAWRVQRAWCFTATWTALPSHSAWHKFQLKKLEACSKLLTAKIATTVAFAIWPLIMTFALRVGVTRAEVIAWYLSTTNRGCELKAVRIYKWGLPCYGHSRRVLFSGPWKVVRVNINPYCVRWKWQYQSGLQQPWLRVSWFS